MARLNQKEFEQSMALLADEVGLQRLVDKFFKYRGLVTRRGFREPQNLASHVYTLSAGLRREVPANIAFQAIWSEHLSQKLGEEGVERLEKLADAVNACLEGDDLAEGKEADLDRALAAYHTALAEAVGEEFARFDMLMKAVPAVAERLRNPSPPAPEASEQPVGETPADVEAADEPKPD